MGRVKAWWMEQIEEICERYVAERFSGKDEQAAFQKSLEELTLQGIHPEGAAEWLNAAWFGRGPPSDN